MVSNFPEKKQCGMFLLFGILICSNICSNNLSTTSAAFTTSQYSRTTTTTAIPHIQQKEQLDHTFVLHAKKKKGGKGKSKGQKKQSGFEWATSFQLKPFEAKATRELASTACASFEGRTGKPLAEELQGSSDIPKSLWNAPVACVVVSSIQKDDATDAEDENDVQDPNDNGLVIKYANVAALETVGLKPDQWERFIAMPDQTGILKVPENPVVIDLPSDMKGDKKYVGGYTKKIIRGAGEGDDDTSIVNAHRWSIEKSSLLGGKFVTEVLGVAYAWDEWLIGEDVVCRPGGVREERLDPEDIEERVQTQAAAIRELKEVQGFGNKDPEVIDAVEELKRLKTLLEDIKA